MKVIWKIHQNDTKPVSFLFTHPTGKIKFKKIALFGVKPPNLTTKIRALCQNYRAVEALKPNMLQPVGSALPTEP